MTFGIPFMNNLVRFGQGRDCCSITLVILTHPLMSRYDRLVGRGVDIAVIPELDNNKRLTESGSGGIVNKLGVLFAANSTRPVSLRDGSAVINVLPM